MWGRALFLFFFLWTCLRKLIRPKAHLVINSTALSPVCLLWNHPPNPPRSAQCKTVTVLFLSTWLERKKWRRKGRQGLSRWLRKHRAISIHAQWIATGAPSSAVNGLSPSQRRHGALRPADFLGPSLMPVFRCAKYKPWNILRSVYCLSFKKYNSKAR